MGRRLIQETLNMLQQQIEPDTAIRLAEEAHLLERLAAVIEKTGLHKERQMTILGSYILLQQATASHQQLEDSRNDTLTRSILDGDYLLGAYYRLLSQNNEMKLMSQLAPIYKKLQLSLLLRRPMKRAIHEIYQAFQVYIAQANREVTTP